MKAPTTLDQDRYRLEGLLGEGGMAQVFRARDTHLGVVRAIKMLAPSMVGKARAEKRFMNEARTMARLEHPHIVRVLDVRREGELPYMVMELVPGGSLSELLHRSGSLPPVRALGIMEQVLSAIGHAHEQGVVHRDIKPGNILLDDDGTCRVTDFGIARVREPELSAQTRTGAVMGTWGYMAPEQRRDAKHIDQRADVYALGALLYVLVTGQAPMELFAATTVPGLLDAVPGPLVPIITRACAFDPAERFDGCEDFRRALQEVAPALGLGGAPPVAGRRAFVPSPDARLTRLSFGDDPLEPLQGGHGALDGEATAPPPATRWRGPLWLMGAAVVFAIGGVWLLSEAPERPASERPQTQEAVVQQGSDLPEAPVDPIEASPGAAEQAVRGLAVTRPRVPRQQTTRPVAPPEQTPKIAEPAAPPLEPAQRLARFAGNQDWPDALIQGDRVDPGLAVELSRVIGLDYATEEESDSAKGIRVSLIHLLNNHPDAGVAFVDALAERGELTGFMAHPLKGQGGDFSTPILRAMGERAPVEVKAPATPEDCRALALYVDLLNRPEQPGVTPDWIAPACQACTTLNEGVPVGKCDA